MVTETERAREEIRAGVKFGTCAELGSLIDPACQQAEKKLRQTVRRLNQIEVERAELVQKIYEFQLIHPCIRNEPLPPLRL